jgi:hypothetical protein
MTRCRKHQPVVRGNSQPRDAVPSMRPHTGDRRSLAAARCQPQTALGSPSDAPLGAPSGAPR